MSKLFKFLAPLLIFSSIFIIPPQKAMADVGVVPGKNGMITVGDKTDDIKMSSEKVIFDITDNAHVTAEFEMLNTSSNDVTLEILFPIQTQSNDTDHLYLENVLENELFQNLEIIVNDKSVEYEFENYNLSTTYVDGTPEQVIAAKFDVTFKASEETIIELEYDASFINEPKSSYGTYNYVMETGSHWKGKIGSGEVIFQFPSDISKAVFLTYNKFFEMKDNQLVWKFENLEPTNDHNITVTYNPELLEVWKNRNLPLKEISSNGDTDMFTDSIPETTDYEDIKLLNWGYVDGIAMNLIDPSEDATGGWLAEYSEGDKPWVKFDFDAVYRVYSASILSGISSENYSGQKNTEKFYSLLSRPKVVTLSFSDGSTETINLDDTPAELQKEAFNEVETSFVKVTVNEVYPGETLDKDILGIGRMNFEVGDKVAELDEDKDTNSSSTSTVGPLVNYEVEQSFLKRLTTGDLRILLLAVLGIAAVGLFAALGIIGSKRKQKERAKTPSDTMPAKKDEPVKVENTKPEQSQVDDSDENSQKNDAEEE
ncbi:MAG: hypothetical protein PHS44_07455 [Candidatus Dojkabacteria bacterium]|nr:hypothetical protein [Candidatus Dojkabacteria bacterium]